MKPVSHEQIVRECVYAVACCIDHYCDEGLSEEGFEAVRKALMQALPKQDSGIAYNEADSHCFDGCFRFSDRIQWLPEWRETEDHYTPKAMEARLNERGYFLRDDRPIREGDPYFKGREEAYSLYTVPFERHAVFGGPREWAVLQAYKQVFET